MGSSTVKQFNTQLNHESQSLISWRLTIYWIYWVLLIWGDTPNYTVNRYRKQICLNFPSQNYDLPWRFDGGNQESRDLGSFRDFRMFDHISPRAPERSLLGVKQHIEHAAFYWIWAPNLPNGTWWRKFRVVSYAKTYNLCTLGELGKFLLLFSQ